MGSAVKTAVGLAGVFFAPTLGSLAFGYGVSAGLSVTTAGLLASGAVIGATLVSASIAGSALTPQASDVGGAEAYAGQKLQTQKTNTAPVPILYGYNRSAGNIVFQETNDYNNANSSSKGYNRSYWGVYVMAGHDINDLISIKADDITLTESGSGIWYDSGRDKIFIKGQYISSDTNVTALSFPYSSTLTATGSTIGLSSAVIPAGTYVLLVHQIFDAENNVNTKFANITTYTQGKKIKTFTDSSTISSTTSYSYNPANIVYDLLVNALAVTDSEIDIESFYNSQQNCSTNGWYCHLALIQQNNIQSIISDVLATCRGQLHHCEGQWRLKIDTKSQTSVKTIDNDDIINNSFTISMKGNQDIANKLIFKFVNVNDDYQSDQKVVESSTLQSLDGQTIEKILDVKGVTDVGQASELCEITLNTMRYSEDASGNRVNQTPLICSFGTTVKHADLEIGDVITIDHDLLDRNRKFMILSMETDQSGFLLITAREYAETHYKDDSGTYLI